MPKTSSTDCINVTFEEIGEALNNPKLREGFLNGNNENEIINELVEIFDQQEMKKQAQTLHADARTNKIPHIPARVSHNSVPVTDTDRRPRVIQKH